MTTENPNPFAWVYTVPYQDWPRDMGPIPRTGETVGIINFRGDASEMSAVPDFPRNAWIFWAESDFAPPVFEMLVHIDSMLATDSLRKA